MSIIKYRDSASSPWQTIDAMKGRDAIHVGPSAPTDPEIDMWLDTDEPGQTAVTSVNGMSGPVTIGTYESGIDGIWTYRKYSDGTYHAWCNSAVNLAAGTAWAGGYYHLSSSALTPPSFSLSVDSLVGAARGAVLMAYVGYSTSTLQSYWLNGASAASNNVAVHLDLYGTW